MKMVLFEVNGEIKIDGFTDDVKIFSREGFIRVEDGKTREMLALYNPTRLIAIRNVQAPPIPAKPPETDLTSKISEEPNAAEPVHQGDRPEEQQDSPDRGSAG